VPFTGYHSCLYCLEKGEVVKTSQRGHVMTFPFRQTLTGHEKLREEQEVLENCYDAIENNSKVSMHLYILRDVTEIYNVMHCILNPFIILGEI